ncbi:Uncharacterised protein [Enterobacter hormaechei]|nr:Uncharacterised protein [Enterobacter hormaechei]
MPEVLRNVVKRQARKRHPDAAKPAHHPHPAHFFRHHAPEDVREDGGEEEYRPDLKPLGGGEAQFVNKHHRHDDGKPEQGEGVDDTHHAGEQNTAVGVEQRRRTAQLGEFFPGGESLHMPWRFHLTHRDQRNDPAGYAECQRQPQGAHLPDVRNGKARNVAAEHADADRVNRPEPAQRRAGTVAANVMHNGDDKGIEEQRIGQAADPVEQQN